MKRVVIALTAVSMLGGCGVFGGKDKAKTPTIGERVPVLAAESRVEVDPALADVPIALPAVQANADWAQPGGNAPKSMSHVALGASLGRAWIASIGNGSEPRQRLASGPVVAAGRVYTIDTQAVARAFDATSGRPVWAREVGDAKERRGSISILTGESKGAHGLLFGGGVAFDNGRIYATSGLGDVEAIDAATGAMVWRVRPGGPVARRSDDRERQCLCDEPGQSAVRAQSGRRQGALDSGGTVEVAGVFGAASPAAAQGTVVAAFRRAS
jgi:hypothetical protein